jgi:cold shock CspA family protein
MDRQRWGTVNAFSAELGLGEVVSDDQRYAFHATQLVDGTRTIEVGASVVFDLAAGGRGRYEAVRVSCAVAAGSSSGTGARPSFACPVCTGQVDGKPRDYEICSTCGWEDDPVQFDDPSSTGANRGSLNEARVEWKRRERQ